MTKQLLYCSCFIIAMMLGMFSSSPLDKKEIFDIPGVFAIGNEDSTQTPQIPEGTTTDMKAPINPTPPKQLHVSSRATNTPVNAATTQIDEQFNGSSLDTRLWTVMNRPAGYRNNEEQTYASSQVALKDGHLVITAQRDQSGAWLSGEVNSKWAYTYGDFEVRARLSAHGPGVWPAAWLFNTAGIWPGGGEIDLYESINSDMSVYGTIHANSPSGHWQNQGGVHNIDPRNYHTYKISKQPGVISWWVDGVKRTEWRKESLSSDQSWPFEDFTYMGLLNLAIGGNWPGPSNETTPSKIEYHIDYFTVKNAR